MTERKRSCWEQVEKRLRSHDPSEQHLHTLELNFKHLPDYLKPCFLYFGAFPEDTEISARRLVQLWIAEGFVQPPKLGQNSPEDEAGKYLDDLVDRSLVMIAKRSSLGEVKACRIHDLVHEFCLARAKQENFLIAVDKPGRSSRFHDPELHQQYRLCIHCNMIPPVTMGFFETPVRTLLISESRGIYQDWSSVPTAGKLTSRLATPRPHDELCRLDVVKFKFRLLRVLDMGDLEIDDKSDFLAITQMVHLRFLALVYRSEIPAEISNLKSLEAFLLDGASGGVLLPNTVWNMASLRHLHIGKVCKSATAFFYLQYHNPEVFVQGSNLDGLTSISNLTLHIDKDVEKTMRMLPNLRKLRCVFSVSSNFSLNSNHCPTLDFLNQLEALKISLSCRLQYTCHSRFLTETSSVIGQLPNLEVLKLLNMAFKGKQWDMKEGEFQKTKVPEIRSPRHCYMECV